MDGHQCKFEGPAGDKCTRSIFDVEQIESEPYCVFHYGCKRKPGEDKLDNPQFPLSFKELITAGDGNWNGFIFPADVKLPKTISFAINALGCRISSLILDNVTFNESVDFSDTIFKENLIIKSATFESEANFDRCQFEGAVEILNVQFKKTVSFNHADFSGRTLLKANFHQNTSFNWAIFRDVTVFSGWRSVSLVAEGSVATVSMSEVLTSGANLNFKQKITAQIKITRNVTCQFIKLINKAIKSQFIKAKNHFRHLKRKFAKSDPNAEVFMMFEAEGQLQGVIFLKPDKVLFSQVNLSKVYFQGTNLRGVRFLGVNWWQPAFKRNGLYDEIFIGKSSDGPFRHLYLPILEETCRNTRVALEENKSFNMASDFYIAEMEAVRQQQNILERHILSVTALYRFVSRYGTSVGTSIRVLALIYFLHVSSSLYIHSPIPLTELIDEFMATALRSIKVMLLAQPETKSGAISNGQSWLDVGLRLIGPIQIAMIAMAFRSRIKRH